MKIKIIYKDGMVQKIPFENTEEMKTIIEDYKKEYDNQINKIIIIYK